MKIKALHAASCHCGAVKLELMLPNGIENPRRCNCSICSKRGAVAASVVLDGLNVVQGQEHLRLYQFNTMTAKHYFCSICGIYTHHQRRSNPQEFGFNVACLEGVSVFDIKDVPVLDGTNHPRDQKP